MQQRVTEAAAAYAGAYNASRAEISTGDDDQGVRIQDGFVSVTGVVMPADAALRSSLTAVRSLAARTGLRSAAARAGVGGGGGGGGEGRLDGPEDALLFGLIVKRMNIRPEGSPRAGDVASAEPLRGR